MNDKPTDKQLDFMLSLKERMAHYSGSDSEFYDIVSEIRPDNKRSTLKLTKDQVSAIIDRCKETLV